MKHNGVRVCCSVAEAGSGCGLAAGHARRRAASLATWCVPSLPRANYRNISQ